MRKQIDAEYKSVYSDPVPLPDGRVEVTFFDRITWRCVACGLPHLYFGLLSQTMEHQCNCGRSYEIDGVHGLTPRVSLLEESEQYDGHNH